MKRSNYGSYFKKAAIQSANGKVIKDKFVYTGDYFRFDSNKKDTFHIKLRFFILSIASFLLYFLGGFINTGGLKEFYVVLPYVCAFLPIALTLFASFQLFFHKGDFTIFDYNGIWLRLKKTIIAAACLLAVCLTGEIIFLIIHFHFKGAFNDLIYLLCCVSILISNLSMLKLRNRTSCFRVDNSNRGKTIQAQSLND